MPQGSGGKLPCMEGLAQYKNLDALIATALQAHPRDWRVLSQAARLIGQAPHFGVLNGQTFVREQSQGFVQVDVTTYEEDRIQALQWYVQALELCGEIIAMCSQWSIAALLRRAAVCGLIC